MKTQLKMCYMLTFNTILWVGNLQLHNTARETENCFSIPMGVTETRSDRAIPSTTTRQSNEEFIYPLCYPRKNKHAMLTSEIWTQNSGSVFGGTVA